MALTTSESQGSLFNGTFTFFSGPLNIFWSGSSLVRLCFSGTIYPQVVTRSIISEFEEDEKSPV